LFGEPLRTPNQFRVVGDALMGFEIPIRFVIEPRNVTIEKNKLCPLIMQI
jgi:hypothetical protein